VGFMATRRIPPAADGITLAWIHGTTSRYAVVTGPDGKPIQGDPTGHERVAAIEAIREAATIAGTLRADLLSQQAGLLAGLALGTRGEHSRSHYEVMRGLIAEAAGEHLNPAIVEEWAAIGIDRAPPRQPPSTSLL
jgi:hypothetical protein